MLFRIVCFALLGLVCCNDSNVTVIDVPSSILKPIIISEPISRQSSQTELVITKCKVEIIGDSQVGNVLKFAQEDAKRNNWNLQWDYVVGTRISFWEKRYQSHDDVDLTVIFLGSNDYGGNPNPSNLLSKIDNECIWVGLPDVRGSGKRVNKILKQTTSKCTYVDSLNVPLGDKIHPTYKGAKQWWNSVSVLIQQKCNSTHS